jgi:Tfp pilus assembly PilM family ATPase
MNRDRGLRTGVSEVARIRDITSTENLLNVIRSRKEEPASSPGPSAPRGRKRGHFRFPLPVLPNLVSLRKTATVGIDIGHEYLRMVRATGNSDGIWQILDRRKLALPPKTPRDTPAFSIFLKTSLTAFCGSAKRSNLWAIMSAARVDVRNIRVPKVSKKQLGNVVYWTAKKESPFDEKELIFDFESQGEVIEQGIPKLAVMVYTAPRKEIEDLKAQFSRIGWPLTGVSIIPFAVQNLFRTAWIPTIEGTIASLFIGNDFSRIDIYANGNLVMTRGIKAALSSMVESLIERFSERKPDPEAPSSLTPEQGRKIVRSLSPDTPPLEKTDVGYDFEKEAIFEMIKPALERLARQVERTFEHYATTMPGDRIAKVFVSGAMNIYQPIVDYVGNQLGIRSTVLDPLSGHTSDTCTLDEIDTPCVSERIAFAPALGLALSGNDHTPNLISIYKDKEREANVIRINRTVLAIFIASVLICSGFFIYQNIAIVSKRDAITGIEMQIARLGPSVDRGQLLKMAAKVTQRRQLSRSYADRYLGMVLISELAALTPPGVRFTDLRISLGPAAVATPVDLSTPSKEQPKEASKTRIEEITAEGLIIGERQQLETSLAAYIMALEASPLFHRVTIQKNVVEPYIKGEALSFILNLKVEEQVHG